MSDRPAGRRQMMNRQMRPGQMGRQPQAAHMMALAQYLNLTPEQVTQIKGLAKQQGEQSRQLHQQLRGNRESLRGMMHSSGAVDQAKAGQLMAETKGLAEKGRSARKELGEKTLAVLTPEQKQKLAALQDAAKLMPSVGAAMRLGLIEAPQRNRGKQE